MDEVKVEKTPTATHTTINRAEPPSSGSGSMLWFIVGGLVVAIVDVGYFLMGDTPAADSAAAPAGGDVSVNVDTAPAADPAPAEAAPADPAPEAAPVEE